MKNMKAQKGMTAIGWLLVLIIAGIAVLIGIKLVPVYITGYSMYSQMDKMEKNRKFIGMPLRQARKLVMDNFDISFVRAVQPEDVTITKTSDGLEINVAYEVVRPVLGNLSLLVVFDKTILIR